MSVESSKMAHLKGIGTLIHIKFEKFIFSPKSATRGRFSSAIARKHGNRHKIKTKAHTRVIEVSIHMFSWSQNSFMKSFQSYFKQFLFYGPKIYNCDVLDIHETYEKHILKCFQGLFFCLHGH